MEAIKALIREKEQTILLKGFDPVSAEGFTQIPNFILKSETLSAGAKIVYALLLSYAWHNAHCFPGQATLAKSCGKSQGWVSQQMRELQRGKLLEIERRGQGKTNIYTLCYRVDGKNGENPG
ncbi:MAG: helix-turn-helix domain-containing protein [Anaerolineales bacterium]|nr:helix-turn-helix domain-containing protein [Anaerolineales bacterium]